MHPPLPPCLWLHCEQRLVSAGTSAGHTYIRRFHPIPPAVTPCFSAPPGTLARFAKRSHFMASCFNDNLPRRPLRFVFTPQMHVPLFPICCRPAPLVPPACYPTFPQSCFFFCPGAPHSLRRFSPGSLPLWIHSPVALRAALPDPHLAPPLLHAFHVPLCRHRRVILECNIAQKFGAQELKGQQDDVTAASAVVAKDVLDRRPPAQLPTGGPGLSAYQALALQPVH